MGVWAKAERMKLRAENEELRKRLSARSPVPSWAGDFWNHTQNVMEYLEGWVDIESDPERAGLLVADIQALKEAVNHYDLANGFAVTYEDAGPYFHPGRVNVFEDSAPS